MKQEWIRDTEKHILTQIFPAMEQEKDFLNYYACAESLKQRGQWLRRAIMVRIGIIWYATLVQAVYIPVQSRS